MLLGWILAPAVVVRAIVRALRRRQDAGERLGLCPVCNTTVFETDPHLKYRGDYWHAEPCVEGGVGGPAALRYRRLH